MAGQDAGRLVVALLVQVSAHGDCLAARVGGPAWVSPAALGLQSRQRKCGFDAARVVVLFRIDAAPVEALDFHLSVFHVDACEVVGGLDQTCDVGAHPVDAHGARLNGEQQRILVFFTHHVARQRRGGPFDGEVGIGGGVFRVQCVAAFSQGRFQGGEVLLGAHQSGFRLTRDGVAKASALNGGDPQVHVIEGLEHHPVAQFVGVGQAFVNVHAAVASGGPAHHEFECDVALGHGGFLGVRAPRREVHTARAADADFVVVLGVEVEQDVP